MKKKDDKDSFDSYYSAYFLERWITLKKAMLEKSNQIEYSENLLKPYYLDYASIEAAKALPYLDEGKCLDMCAAPGGKTLVLLNSMSSNVEIIANEISAERRNRLIKVLDEHLPDKIKGRVKVTGFDACKMPKFEKETYERILLDAPCSSEKHVLKNEKYLKQWSKARIKNLAFRQWALLSAAFLLLRPEGFLVYSTCALSQEENDFIIKKLITKYKNRVVIQNIKKPAHAEKTELGYRFLPDTADGAGPIYFSLISKK